jgi:hypothetical protein
MLQTDDLPYQLDGWIDSYTGTEDPDQEKCRQAIVVAVNDAIGQIGDDIE